MRQDKHLLLDEVTEYIEKYPHLFVMRYQNLQANLANAFRNEVAKKGGEVHVLRKRLFEKAAQANGFSIDNISLDGHIGLVFSSDDAIEMVKSLIQFSKENNDAIEFVGARVENQMLGKKEVVDLSQLPSKPEMQAQLLSVFEAPLSQTLAVMEALMTSVMHCLENKCKKESGESE